MNKEKRNIRPHASKEVKHLMNILDKSQASEFKKMVPELQDTWMKKQMFRTETEMRFSVLSDNKHGTNASKYWQSVREQNSHFENLMQLSFNARISAVEIKKLYRKLKKEKDPLEQELLEIAIEKEHYSKANMELVAKHRMREIITWSKLKKEFDDGSFDTKDVNTHQADSYLDRLQHMNKTITPGTTQPEVFNLVGQLDTLKRLRKSGKLLSQTKKKKIKHGD
tara:strand:- start:18 stop:689 length:672 start_codon:yes stop_codon:yes gene_type:complete